MSVVGVANGSIGSGQSIRFSFWWDHGYRGPQFVQAQPLFADGELEISDMSVVDDGQLGTAVYMFTLTNKGAATNFNVFTCSF